MNEAILARIRRKDLLKALGLGGILALPGVATQARIAEAQTTAPDYQQVANVLKFGADKTGASDCSSAVLSAIDSLGSRGGTVLFPVGSYRLDRTVLMNTSARLKARFVGGGVKGEATLIKVNFAGVGFDANTGTSLSATAAPEFERLQFAATGAGVRAATLVRYKLVNHGVVRTCLFENARIGLEFDATEVSSSFSADASYHTVEGMCRFNNNTKGILVTANEGGCNVFGGHFICNKQSGDIGVDVTGGWQTRIVGSKFEGGNGGTPTGHGVVIRGGEGVRVQALQSESSKRGVWVSGGKNHYIEGYFSNYVSGCEAGVWVDSGASNVYVNALSGSDTSTRPKIKNRSSTTKVFSTSVTVSLLAKATANNRLGTKCSGSESRDALPLVQQKLPFTNHF